MPETEERVRSAFERLRTWCESNGAAGVFRCMQPPATDDQLDAVEAKQGVKLPDDLRALYKLANGQFESYDPEKDEADAPEEEEAEDGFGMFPSIEDFDLAFQLVPTGDLQESWDRGYGWEEGWIPFGTNAGGDEMVCDLAKDSPKPGRVLQFNHELAAAYPRADSVAAFLEQIADAAEAGRLMYDEDHGPMPAEGHALDFNTLHENGDLEFHNPYPDDDE